MPQYLPLPDGSTVTIRDGETPEQAYIRAQQMYPEAFKTEAPAAPKERSWSEAASDIGASGKAGIGSLLQFPGQMYGLATGDFSPTGLYGYGKELEERGQKEKSAALRGKEEASQARVKEAEKKGQLDAFLTSIGETIKDPALLSSFIAEQVPSQLPALLAGIGTPALSGEVAALRQAAKILGTKEAKDAAIAAAVKKGSAAAVSTGAVQQGADIGTGVYEDMYKKLITQGATPEKAADTSINYARAAGAGAAVISLLAQRLPGARTLEETFAGKRGATGAITGFGKGLLGESGSELTEETGGKFLQNLAMRQIDPTQSLTEGLGATAGQAVIGGGLLGGVAGAYSGMRGEGPAKTQKQTEIEQARADAEKQQEEEKVRLNSPEYAQEVLTQAKALQAQKDALKAQKLKLDNKTASEVDKAFNSDIEAQIKQIDKQLKPLAEEYVRVRPILKQAAEQARVAKLTPQEYAFGMEPEETAKKPAEPELYEQQIAKPPAPPKAEDIAAQHAAQSIQLANDQRLTAEKFDPKNTTPAVSEYVEYLMQNPILAKQVQQNRMKLPGLPAGLRNAEVLDALKLRLNFREKFEAPTPEAPESPQVQAFTSYMDDLKDKRNDVGDDMFFKYMVDPKLEKISEGKPPVIAVNAALMPFAQPKQAERVRSKINTLIDEVDQANTDRDAALRSNNRDAATAAFERGNQALEQLNAFAEPTPAGDLTKGRFPSAKTSPQASVYAKEVLRTRNEQDTALNTIEDKIDRLRRGDALGRERQRVLDKKTGEYREELLPYGQGASAASPAVLAQQAEEARGQYISAVLEEAAIHRRVAGKPALTYDEAIKAASRIHDVVGEWLSRAQAQPKRPELEEVIVQPAQMRANKLIRGAVTKRVLKTRDLATTPLNDIARLSDSEVKHFKAQIAKVVDSLSEMPSQVSRETPLLKQQFATTEAQKVAEARGETAKTAGGEMRRLREYVGNMIDKALTRNIPEGAVTETEDGPVRTQGIREALERVKEIIDDGKASKTLLDAAQNQAARILRGEDLGTQVYTKREVVPGKRVVENVPGREAETRFGERRTYKSVGYEAALAPEGSSLRELQDAIKLYESTAQEGEIAGEGAKGQGQLFPETRKDIGYIRATPANFAKSPEIKPVWEALDQARKLKAKTEANQKARSAKDKQGIEQIQALQKQIDAIKNNMKFFLTKSGDFNLGLYTNVDIAKMFMTYPEAGIKKEDKALMDQYLAVVRNIFNQNYNPSIKQTQESNSRLAKKIFDGLSAIYTPEQMEYVRDKLIPNFNEKIRPEYLIRLKEAQQAVALGQRLEGANNRLVEFMQDSNAAVRKQAEESRNLTDPLLDKIKLIKQGLRGSLLLTDGERAALDSEATLTAQRGAYKNAMAKAMGKARQRLSDTLGELLDPEIERARRALKAAKTRLATVESQIEAAKKEMTEGTGQAPNLINNLQKVQGLVENIETAETELADLQEARFGEIENDVVVTEAMLDKDLKSEREYLELLERQLADMRKEPLTAVEFGERGKLGKLKYPFSAQRVESQVKAQQAAVDEAKKRADEFQKDVQVWWPKVTAAFKKDGISVKDLPGAVFEKGRKVADINTPEQKRLDDLRDNGMQAAKEVDEAAVLQRVKDKQIQIFDDEIFNARGEVQAFMGPEDTNQLADIMADPKTTNVKRVQATLKLGAMQKLASLEAQKEVFLTGKPTPTPKAATVPSTSALAAAKPFRTGSGVAKAFTPAEMDEMDRAELRDANALAKQILGTKAPQLKSIAPAKAARNAKNLLDTDAFVSDLDIRSDIASTGKTQADFEFSRGTPVKGLTKAELEAELTAGMGEPVTGRKIEKQIADKLAVYENLDEYLSKFKEVTQNDLRNKIPADAKGFVQNGKAVLFANNIGKGHGLGVLLHEVGVHMGFRNFFNEGQYNALVKTVKNWANKTEDSMEARVGKAAVRRVEAANTPPHQIDDELLAYAVEEAMQMGVEPVGVKGGNAVKNWLNMVVDAFKKALEKFGITSKNLTAGDLVNFAYGAAHLELKGTWHGTGVMFKMFNHAYMNTGSKAQTYGWGTYRAQRHGTAETYRVDAVTKTGGLYDQWVDRPDIQAWLQTQKPKFTGKLPAGIPEQFLNMPLREANKAYGGENPHKIFKEAVQGEIENIEEDRKQFSNLSNMPRAAQATPVKNYGYGPVTATPARTVARPIVVNTKLKTPIAKPLSWRVEWMQGLSDAEVDKKIQELKKFAETADEHLKVPFVNAVYKGKQFHELWDTNRAAAYTVNVFENTIRENNGTPPTWKEAIAATKVEAKNDLKDFEGSEHPATKDAYNTARKVLDTIDALDVNDFQYNPPSGPPVPEPAGYMMRTLHTRPENEYVLYDSHADKQPEIVKDAFKRIYDGLDKKQQEVFNRAIGHVRPDRQNGRDLYDALSSVLEYSGMPSEMCDMFASEMLHAEGVAGIKFFDGVSRYSATQGSVPGTYNYVDFGDKDEGAQIIATDINPVNQTRPMQKGEMLFSRSATYTNPEIAKNSDFVDKIVAKDKGWTQKLKANLTGLAFETQLVDRFAGFERLAKYMEPLKGTQMLYYLRMYDQRMNFVSQAVSNGAPAIVEKTRPDGRVERVLESKESANIHNVVQILKDAQPMVGNAEAVNRQFTMYMAAIRAGNKGLSSLNFGEDVTQELLNKTMAAIKATPGLEAVFKNAQAEYNEYNRNLIDFVVSTGALSKEVGKRLLRENDYIPFYRERNGVAELLIGGESPIRIGSIAEQPYLHELVGGDNPILDFLTSSVQNTNLLMDMGMRNLATKNAVFELVDLKAAKFVKIAAGPDVVKFRDDGADRYAVIATEKVKIGNKEFDTGVPADILVKGMEGIPTQMPAMLRVMAMPSLLLRKAITISPLYTAKQLFRDSLAAPILSGADFMPVIGALKEINSATKKTLERRGVTGGQQFVGGAEDLTKILRDVSEGKPGWMTALGKLEAMGMEADATTRRAQYNSYIEQGLSEMEATLLALESMNFNKRGASPSIHVANSLIPFFNAQIQGLNVLYKASMGKMPFNDQLRIREKMLRRGAFMAVASLAYAALMQDDEAYKNANPDQKYGNWFVRIPGLDEPIKVPVPFEIGYIFKALPEAIFNSMVNEHGGEEAVKAFKQILLQTVPGGSSYGIPQALKPAIEAGLGKSFYTGRDILSAREKELLPEEQFRANTSELAKSIGKALGISPIVFEQLISGYTGTMGTAFMHALSVGIPASETPEQAVKRLSDYPIVGGAFQPNDAGGIINNVYERMNENLKVKHTFDQMVKEGNMSGAMDLLQRRGNEYMQADMANKFKANMNKLTQAERAIAASNMSPEEKRAQLDSIRKIKIAVAETVRQVSDKTIHLSTPF